MDDAVHEDISMATDDSLASLAVLVVNYGSHAIVEANLTRSLGQGFDGQVVVVDNFSSDDERRAISSVCERHGWTLLASPSNDGFGGGNNVGAALAIEKGATELLLINPDAWLPIDAVRALRAQVRSDPLLQVAPVVVRPDGQLYSAEMDLHLDIGEMRSVRRRPRDLDLSQVHTWVSGACFAVSTQLWRLVGGFDNDYFLYWEDVDFSRRVMQAGGHILADQTLRAVHDEGSTHSAGISERAKSPTYYYYNARNRLLYAAKHLAPETQRRWRRATPRAAYRLLLQGGRRQFMDPLRSFWPALRGSLDGFRMLHTTSGSRDRQTSPIQLEERQQ